jgi:hypothetical protein
MTLTSWTDAATQLAAVTAQLEDSSMFRSKSLQGLIAGLCLITAAACGSSSGGASGGSSNPAGPSSSTLDLAGSWSGKFIFTNSDGTPDPNPGIVAWTATQSGSSVTGPFALTVNDHGDSETFHGTLSGTLSGTQLSLTLSFPTGTFADVPACTITGAGTATPTTSAITSSLTVNFGAPCMGTVSDRPSEVDQLQLTKQ